MASGDFDFDNLSGTFKVNLASPSSETYYFSSTTISGQCLTCGSSSGCSCTTYAPAPPGQWGSIQTNSPAIGYPSLDEAADFIIAMQTCIVCGAEDSVVLCEVCKEAVKLARNKWLDEYRREIASLDQS